MHSFTYYPSGLTQFAAVYVAFGIAFALAVHHVWLRVRGWLRRWLGLAGRVGLQS